MPLRPVRVKILSAQDIEKKARDVLAQWGWKGALPVPVEYFADVILKLNIIETPNLELLYDVAGLLSQDRCDLFIDEATCQRQPARAAFTIAHELGHYILHDYVYEAVSYDSPAEFKSAIECISPDEYRWFEWQANTFAGMLLVPADHLHGAYNRAATQAVKGGFNLKDNRDLFTEVVARHLADQFGVSSAVIIRRLLNSGIINEH